MEKYITFDHIRKKDVSSFTGLENEVLTYIYHSQKKVPLSSKVLASLSRVQIFISSDMMRNISFWNTLYQGKDI